MAVSLGLVISAASGAATAQNATSRGVAFSDGGGWTFTPIRRDGSPLGVFAFRPSGSAYASDITALWFEPVTGSSGGYHVHGCIVQDTDVAIAAIRQRTGFSDLAWHVASQSLATHDCHDVPPAVAFGDVYVTIIDGLAEGDPMQPIASFLDAQEMELLLGDGATGATELSGELAEQASGAPTAATTLFERLDRLLDYADAVEAADEEDLPIADDTIPCWPGTVTITLVGYTWNPTVFLCADGDCLYTGTKTTVVRTCRQRWDCSLYDCFNSNPVTTSTSKKCRPVNGDCPPPPPQC